MKASITVPLEIKALETRQFEGHGSIFGNVDLGGDVVLPGAFKKTLAKHKKDGALPQMFWMHQMDKVPGMWLKMDEDERGLYVKGELAPTPLGDEMHALLSMKAVRGLSIGYVTEDYDYSNSGDRLLKEVDLWEVSIVSLAMNPLAQVESAKSRLSKSGEYVPEPSEMKRNVERALRDVGYSKLLSKKLVSKMFDDDSGETLEELLLRDVGESDTEEEKAMRALAAKFMGLSDAVQATVIADKFNSLVLGV